MDQLKFPHLYEMETPQVDGNHLEEVVVPEIKKLVVPYKDRRSTCLLVPNVAPECLTPARPYQLTSTEAQQRRYLQKTILLLKRELVRDIGTLQTKLPLVPVNINGKPFSYYADTGCTESVISREAAQKVGGRIFDIPITYFKSASGTMRARKMLAAEIEVMGDKYPTHIYVMDK